MESKILLVEGDSDKYFFQKLFEIIKLDVSVTVNTPKDLGAGKDGKNKEFFKTAKMLIENLRDGRVTHFAMVLDADSKQYGSGYENTRNKIMGHLRDVEKDYGDPENSMPGLIFPHSDGLPSIGLWIMPDNKSEGMFEDWIKETVTENEKPLLIHAMDTVEKLTQQKFKQIHKSKAEIATWLAWQTNPGVGLFPKKEDLIDLNSQLAKDLINWLERVYT